MFLNKINNFFHKLKSQIHNSNFNIVGLLFSAFVFRLFISNFGTLDLDHGTFVAWGNSLVNNGFKNFYSGWSDYFPGYLYLLYLVAKLTDFLPELQTIFFKLPAIISDFLTGYLIYKIVKDRKEMSWGLFAATIYLFNPAIFANSSLWGQADSLTALFSLFAIYIFPKNFYLSAISLAIGTLIKPQAAFILPSILYLFLQNRTKILDMIGYAAVGLIVFILGFVPFNNGPDFNTFILNRFEISSSQYPYGSVNAFNFWGLWGFWKPDNITFWIGLALSIVIIVVVSLIIYKKKIKDGEYQIAFISLSTTFLFMTRIHERHLLPVLAPLLIVAIKNPILMAVYAGLSFTYIINLYYAFQWITKNFKEIFNLTVVRFLILINISALVLSIVSYFKKINVNFKLAIQQKSSLKMFKSPDISIGRAKIAIALILLFSLVTRLYSLGSIKEMYFDEIYHAFTARLVLQGDPKAWEWWNPHPEGFAYEWTHPPISKLGMTLGMYVFGDNSFGWRLPQAILGTLSVYLIYLLTLKIFNRDRLVALLAAAVFSLEGLPLVLSRMGMNDSYVLFFALLSILLFLKDKNLLSAMFFGLAIASKWSGIYVAPIIAISHFVFKKKFSISYLSFLFIPIVVYVASYSVMFATGHTWQQFIEVQKQMWWYHTNLVAEHPYTSPAWSWPLLLRPIYLYDGQVVNNLVARIYAIGNPVILWFGLASIIFSVFASAKDKNKKLGFVVFSYLVLFIPWLASPRIMFLYHYLPSIPFLAIASGFMLRRFPKLAFAFLAFAFLAFVYFYPHWTGLRIPLWLDESYYWFPSWR